MGSEGGVNFSPNSYRANVPDDEPLEECGWDEGCWYCDGDGMDPLNDYTLPCPFCWEGE